MNEWYEKNEKYIFESENGCAIIEHSTQDGYTQHSQPLEREKAIAESRLKKIH